MLASAVSVYMKRYAAVPGRSLVIFTNNDSAYRVVHDAIDAGVVVKGVVDLRDDGVLAAADAARCAGVPVYLGHAVTAVKSNFRGVKRINIGRLSADGRSVVAHKGSIECDVLAMSGGWNPTVHLHAQSGGRPVFDEANACFCPGISVQAERSTGACAGEFDLSLCLVRAVEAASEALRQVGIDPVTVDTPGTAQHSEAPLRALWSIPGDRVMPRGKKFVDYQNDTTEADIRLAAREGYRSIEHVKRYTALGFGTDQGKLGNVNGMAILADALGQSPGAIGTTTYRPNYTPVTFGAIAGRAVGEILFDPIRRTPMHEWHVEKGAAFEDVGQWKRPWYYPLPGEDREKAVSRECLATRQGVGILDASTLGKIEITGRDAAELLDRIYTNAWKSLSVGRCRYGLMLGEDGMVMDDGVTSRLSEYRYLMTTTTGGAAHVLNWLERWLQTEWPELEVFLTSVTDRWSVTSIAGPKSRELLESLSEGIDLSPEALPFMSFCEGRVAGIAARVFRISFSGEVAYEINVNADQGLSLWRTVMEAGKPFGITPYGTDAMHVLRAEKGYVIVGQDTDGSVTPIDLGMDWIVSKKKDFIGKRSLFRADTARANRKQLVGLKTEDSTVVLPEGAQLVNGFSSSRPVPMVGHVTSSYFSATLGHSIALALIKGGRARLGGTVYAPLLDGQLIKATITEPVFYDSDNVRQRD
jgi:sarcosine oxidase subunit alpha